MRFSNGLAILLALVLILSAVTPALAGEATASDRIQVQIQNKTGEQVRLTLTGPATYYVNLNTGKNKVEVTPGKYSYSYRACGGQTLTGKFDAKKAGVTLTLPKCPKGEIGGNASGKLQIQIQNKTGEQVRLTLTGPATYYVNLNTGKNKVEVIPGKYSYSYKACGGQSFTGKFDAKKSGATLTIPKCSNSAKGGEGKVTTNNNTGGTLTLFLSGPASYSLTFAPGRTSINLVPGKYNFTVYACGTSLSGTRIIKGKFVWMWWCD